MRILSLLLITLLFITCQTNKYIIEDIKNTDYYNVIYAKSLTKNNKIIILDEVNCNSANAKEIIEIGKAYFLKISQKPIKSFL